MRVETIQKELYTFDALSDEAKGKAINNHRDFESQEYFWQNENNESLKEFENIFPVKIKEWEYGNRSYINWTFTGEETIEDLSGWRLVSYLWNNYRQYLWKGKWYPVKSHKKIIHKRVKSKELKTGPPKGEFYNSYYSAITLDTSCVLTGYCMDDEILSDVYQYMKKPDSRAFYDLMNDCLHNWLSACEKDYEWRLEDEQIIETIQANEYEFTSDGEIA